MVRVPADVNCGQAGCLPDVLQTEWQKRDVARLRRKLSAHAKEQFRHEMRDPAVSVPAAEIGEMVLRTRLVSHCQLGQSGANSDIVRNQVIEPGARQQARRDIGQTLGRMAPELSRRRFEAQERPRDREIEDVLRPVFEDCPKHHPTGEHDDVIGAGLVLPAKERARRNDTRMALDFGKGCDVLGRKLGA